MPFLLCSQWEEAGAWVPARWAQEGQGRGGGLGVRKILESQQD